MAITQVTIERINEVSPHPDADRLDVVQVLGYQVITGRGNFQVGDHAVYFPPDILLPEEAAIQLGVEKYLKHARFPGDITKSQCRVSACRLRGLPSHGFLVPVDDINPHWGTKQFGLNVTKYFDAKKYVAPERTGCGDAQNEILNFPRYTNIENIQRGCSIEEGTEVVITEKIHGTNVRMGLVLDDTPEGQVWNYAAGSHKVRRKEGEGLYWQFMTDNIHDMLALLQIHDIGEETSVVVYGEIFGPGVQDLDYGQIEKQLTVFDIALDGKYLNYDLMLSFCQEFGIKTVPLLYRGPFSLKVVEELTYGSTTFQDVRSKFKGREGCVVKPVEETLDYRGNRVIFKSVSADYQNRKGATDDA